MCGDLISNCPIVVSAIKEIDESKTIYEAKLNLAKANYVLMKANERMDQIKADK